MAEYNKEFEESRLKFLFEEEWTHIVQFDEHTDYQKLKAHLNETKGVDFLGILNKQVYFFEVKNFKDYRIENKDRLTNAGETLMQEVAQKVRDSLACIVSGSLNSTNDQSFWSDILSSITNGEPIKVILWLETDNLEPTPTTRGRSRNQREEVNISDLQRKLQSKLKWLTPTRGNVLILNQNNYDNTLHLKIENSAK